MCVAYNTSVFCMLHAHLACVKAAFPHMQLITHECLQPGVVYDNIVEQKKLGTHASSACLIWMSQLLLLSVFEHAIDILNLGLEQRLETPSNNAVIGLLLLKMGYKLPSCSD